MENETESGLMSEVYKVSNCLLTVLYAREVLHQLSS